jgi:two-component system, OmpR family, phosphate regulon sensor histidine kinase PhoR
MPKSDLVLVALGEEQIQRLFERALAAASYRLAIAHEKNALNRVLQEATPALIILGQDFGDGDGVSIAEELLDRFPTLPILVFVSHDPVETVRRALHIGVSDCLFAPLKIEDIMKAVENSVRRANRLGDWTRREVRRTTASLQQRVDELQKFDTILNHIEDGVIILDEQMNILLINPAIRRAFGIWEDEEVMGKPVTEVITHPELREIIKGGANKVSPHTEITFEDGRVLSAQFAFIPKIGSAITLQDISYLRQIDRLKNEFVSTVSHDLRSPLTAILGYIDLLERVGPVNERQREFIDRAQESVHSITLLVNDLMELGRIEAGLDSQKEMVVLEDIIRYALENANDQIRDKHLDVATELPEEIPLLRGNPIRLRQLLDNVVGNAIKYTSEGEKVRIEVEVQHSQVILRVKDTGPGIPPTDQPHIFEKFYRASNVPKGVGGSGLGLAIVKSIVDNHRGRIWVESVLGQGSTFTVVFPVASQP